MAIHTLNSPYFAPKVIQYKFVLISGSSTILSFDSPVQEGSVLIMSLVGTGTITSSAPGWEIVSVPIVSGIPSFEGAFYSRIAEASDGTLGQSVGFSMPGPNGYALIAEIKGLSGVDTFGELISTQISSGIGFTSHQEPGRLYSPAGEIAFFLSVTLTGDSGGMPNITSSEGEVVSNYRPLIISLPFYLSLGFVITNMAQRKPNSSALWISISMAGSGFVHLSSCTARGV